nr:ribonuclease H-like domain-containing protein [Tanacetum cinerariifolium]
TDGLKAVSAVKGNGVTAVQTLAGYVWRPRVNEIDQISKDNRWICTHVDYGHPQQALKNKEIVDSGCSKHMTWNKAYLAYYQEISDGGFVAFGSSRGKAAQRALVKKSHNKTPYEILNGKKPRLDFMRPIDCPVTILNTLDPLEKFEEEDILSGIVDQPRTHGTGVKMLGMQGTEEEIMVKGLQKRELSSRGGSYQYGLKSIEGQLRVHQQNKVIYEEKIGVLEYDVKDKSNLQKYTQKQLDESLRDKEDLKAKLEKFETSLKNLKEKVTENVFDNRSSDEENSIFNDRFKKGKGYHAVPPPLTGNYMPPKSDLSFTGLDDSIYKFKISETVTSLTTDEKDTPETSTTCVKKPKEDKSSAPLIQDWDTNSDNDNVFRPAHIPPKIDFVKDDRMAKNSVLPNNVGKGTGQRESRPVWNNVQRINYQNKFSPTAVFTKSGRILVNAAKPKVAASTSAAKPVNIVGPKQRLACVGTEMAQIAGSIGAKGLSSRLVSIFFRKIGCPPTMMVVLSLSMAKLCVFPDPPLSMDSAKCAHKPEDLEIQIPGRNLINVELEKNEMASIINQLPKNELQGVLGEESIRKPLNEFNAEQQGQLKDLAINHFAVKNEIIAQMKYLYPGDEWEFTKVIREKFFQGRQKGREFDLEHLQKMLSALKERGKSSSCAAREWEGGSLLIGPAWILVGARPTEVFLRNHIRMQFSAHPSEKGTALAELSLLDSRIVQGKKQIEQRPPLSVRSSRTQMDYLYPGDEWEFTKVIREKFFQGRQKGREYDLKHLQKMLSTLKERGKSSSCAARFCHFTLELERMKLTILYGLTIQEENKRLATYERFLSEPWESRFCELAWTGKEASRAGPTLKCPQTASPHQAASIAKCFATKQAPPNTTDAEVGSQKWLKKSEEESSWTTVYTRRKKQREQRPPLSTRSSRSSSPTKPTTPCSSLSAFAGENLRMNVGLDRGIKTSSTGRERIGESVTEMKAGHSKSLFPPY